MRFEGTLKTWYEDRGFGAIAPSAGGDPLFVHISAFPSDVYMPQRGDVLSFEVITASSGRKEASRVQRVRAAVQPNSSRRAPVITRRGPNWMTVTAAVLLATAIGGVGMIRHYQPAASLQFAALVQKTVH